MHSGIHTYLLSSTGGINGNPIAHVLTGISPQTDNRRFMMMPENQHAAPEVNIPYPVLGAALSSVGLAPFEPFCAGITADTDPGMAFVRAQHLPPDHRSILADQTRRHTRMDAFQIPESRVVPAFFANNDRNNLLAALSREKTIAGSQPHRLTKGGLMVHMSIGSSALMNSGGRMYATSTTERPVSGDTQLDQPQ